MMKILLIFMSLLFSIKSYAFCPEPSLIQENKDWIQEALGIPESFVTLNEKKWQVQTLLPSPLLQEGHPFELDFDTYSEEQGVKMCFYKLQLPNEQENTLILIEKPPLEQLERSPTTSIAGATDAQQVTYGISEMTTLSSALNTFKDTESATPRDQARTNCYLKSLKYGEGLLVSRYFALLDELEKKVCAEISLKDIFLKTINYSRAYSKNQGFSSSANEYFSHVYDTLTHLKTKDSCLDVGEGMDIKAQELFLLIGRYLETHKNHSHYSKGWAKLIQTLKNISQNKQVDFQSIQAFVSLGESLLKLFKE